MLVDYVRVSTDGDRQVLDLQGNALLTAGFDGRHRFADRVRSLNRALSGSAHGRIGSDVARTSRMEERRMAGRP